MATTRKIIKRAKSTSTVGYYVRNADLLPAIIEAKQEGKVTSKLILMIQMIAERYSRKGNFVNYSFREDMVSSAVENLCKNALKFDEQKYSNPFAYYTTGIHNSFLQYMADEKKHRNIRDALLIDAGANPSFNFLQQEKGESDSEIKEADEHYVEEPAEDGEPVEEVVDPRLDPTAVPIVRREDRIGQREKQPGKVTKFGPNDIEIDPVTGAIRIKRKPVEPEPIKKSRKPRVVKEKSLEVPEKPVKKAPVKKVPVKAPAKKTTKKVVEEAPKKKAPAKKTIKPAEKKVAAKKTTKKAK